MPPPIRKAGNITLALSFYHPIVLKFDGVCFEEQLISVGS